MSIIKICPEFHNQLYLLLPEEKRDVLAVFETAFTDHHLYEFKDYLSDALECCLTTEEPPFHSEGARQSAIHYDFAIRKLLEAGYVIANWAPSRSPRPDNDAASSAYQNIDGMTRHQLAVACEYLEEKVAYFSSKTYQLSVNLNKVIDRIHSLYTSEDNQD